MRFSSSKSLIFGAPRGGRGGGAGAGSNSIVKGDLSVQQNKKESETFWGQDKGRGGGTAWDEVLDIFEILDCEGKGGRKVFIMLISMNGGGGLPPFVPFFKSLSGQLTSPCLEYTNPHGLNETDFSLSNPFFLLLLTRQMEGRGLILVYSIYYQLHHRFR